MQLRFAEQTSPRLRGAGLLSSNNDARSAALQADYFNIA